MSTRCRTQLTAAALSVLASSTAAMALPDVVLCQIYGLGQWSATGTVRTLAIATTSWNIGDSDLPWMENPDSEHPVIAMNMYRQQNGRFEQIGTSWLKHGFFALADFQCDMPNLPNCSFEPGHGSGDYLGQGCTDTYDAFLNANDLGPRFEINPWSGAFNYNTSLYNTGGMPNINQRRLRVEDADMNPALHEDAEFYFEAYYVHFQDRNHMNSAAWKTCTPNRNGSGNYSFSHSSAGTLPNWGFALDAWEGASQTILAQQIPVVEGVSPDGRCVIGHKVTDNGDGTWHYEYAILNVDMNRQLDAVIIPVPDGVTVTNMGFHAPDHTEPRAWVGGPTLNNAPWTMSNSGGELSWTTTTNSLRWGTLYNFRFDADTPPTDVEGEFSPFRNNQSGDQPIFAIIPGPSAPTVPGCPADLDGMNGVDIDDLNQILAAFGSNVGIGSPLDLAGGDGEVNIDDLNVVLAVFGTNC